MSSRLINVRLDPERLHKARRLREEGITLSDLVREAIDARFDALQERRDPRELRASVSRMLEEHPDPPGLPPRTYDVHDRRAAREAIERRLGKRSG